jgi:hypothetical protein
LRFGGSNEFQFKTAEEGEQIVLEVASGKCCAAAGQRAKL